MLILRAHCEASPALSFLWVRDLPWCCHPSWPYNSIRKPGFHLGIFAVCGDMTLVLNVSVCYSRLGLFIFLWKISFKEILTQELVVGM